MMIGDYYIKGEMVFIFVRIPSCFSLASYED